jgi:hypothetical protein
MVEFDWAKYAELITAAKARSIRDDIELDAMMAAFEPLHFRKDLTPEEDAFYDLLVSLITDYEGGKGRYKPCKNRTIRKGC